MKWVSGRKLEGKLGRTHFEVSFAKKKVFSLDILSLLLQAKSKRRKRKEEEEKPSEMIRETFAFKNFPIS